MKTIELNKGYKLLVDDQDYFWVRTHTWWIEEPSREHNQYVSVKRHVSNSDRTRSVVYLNRAIWETMTNRQMPEDMRVGTIEDRDDKVIDYRRANLVLRSRSSSGARSRKRAGTTSIYKGVCMTSGEDRWRATICLRGFGKKTFLGRFDTEVEAAEAYDRAALRIDPEARINFPEKREQFLQEVA